MDWKFTVVTLILFPSCLLPLRMYGKRAREAVQGEQEEIGQMVVTMQETFAGIRVVKSFGREEHQEKSFRRSNRIQFDNAMRIIRSTEAVGPLVEIIAAVGVGMALLYVYSRKPPGGQVHWPDPGIFLLYDPIKTLSRIHITHATLHPGDGGNFRILDSDSDRSDSPDAVDLPSVRAALIELDRRQISLRRVGSDAITVSTCGSSRGRVTPSSARAVRARAPSFRSFCALRSNRGVVTDRRPRSCGR